MSRQRDDCPDCGQRKLVKSLRCYRCNGRAQLREFARVLNASRANRGGSALVRQRGGFPFADLSEAQRAALRSRYLAGETCADMAPAFRVTPSAVANWLKLLGIPLRRGPKSNP